MSKARQFFPSSVPMSFTSSLKASLVPHSRALAVIENYFNRRFSSQLQCQKEYRKCQSGCLRKQMCRITIERKLSKSLLLKRFSSESGSKTKHDSPPPTKEHPMTMNGMCKESTARLLDRNETPIGSMTSLQWHLAETLALYWSSSQGPPPPEMPQNHYRQRGNNKGITTDGQEDWWKATIESNGLSLRIIDRLAKEKSAFEPCTPDEENFRTIDISLVHAVLKQWKEILHWTNKKSNTRNKISHQHSHQQIHLQERKTEKTSQLLLPSELLQKIDSWASPTDSSIAGSSLIEPNIATFTILMDGAVSCRNYRERVTFTEALLGRLLRESSENSDAASRLRPTAVTIGTVIHALANSRTKESAEKAEAWLRKIPDLFHGQHRLQPNTVIYTTVIRAWADVGRADKAEGLLREMCNAFVGSEGTPGNPDAKPSLWTFNTVLAAWSRSKNPSSVIQAEGLIRTMKSLSSSRKFNDNDEESTEQDKTRNCDGNEERESNSVLELDVTPTIVSYNSLMSTIASRSRQPNSLARAEIWMEEILANAAAAVAERKPISSTRNRQRRGHKMGRKNDDSMAPNFITYRALFNIIAGAGDLTNTEKADRMRYWLARAETLSSQKNFGVSSKAERGTNRLTENPNLLAQIDAMEKRGNGRT